MHNKQYSISGRADDEYDFEDGPSRKSQKKRGANDNKGAERAIARRIMTQQERCLFCFENPNRPRHLVVAIANFTYLVLPQWQSVVPGHCCILPMQVMLFLYYNLLLFFSFFFLLWVLFSVEWFPWLNLKHIIWGISIFCWDGVILFMIHGTWKQIFILNDGCGTQ